MRQRLRLLNELMKFLKFWFPLILYSGIIYYVSSLPELSIPGKWKVDKVMHVTEYLPFGFLTARALGSSGWKWFWAVPAAVLFRVLYGLTDEFHQLSVLGRSCDVFDVVADAVGGTGGALIFLLTSKRRKVEGTHDAY